MAESRTRNSSITVNCLPPIIKFADEDQLRTQSNLLICAEGFEDRSLFFVSRLKNHRFSRTLVLTYHPEKKSRLDELIRECSQKTALPLDIKTYNRFEPAAFETTLIKYLESVLPGIKEVTIDCSVMSKLMILIILYALRTFPGTVRIVYSEPVDYTPTQEEYERQKNNLRLAVSLPSYGVHDVVRTPMLTSVVMQRSPATIVAFASFNEQLIRALLSNFNPTHLLLINGVPPTLAWRESAMQEIHTDIINAYRQDNLLDPDGRLKRRTSTLNYAETFNLLGEIYRKNCVTSRIVLTPTGSKMQSVGCGLIKICCPDIHIEYPTPESYLVDGYSSTEIKEIHHVVFDEFSNFVRNVANGFGLNQ